ncbi:MAG: beta galactosidase jelly roll domain-containing protein [Chloroflexi bacterium]|nr:beta galactosidase jelly roll domain-containing protein [Chloroflexota bacterium]MCI0578200.1 beta galactosidase jelly roll domain-containing protein [Chloroflexota bacterium]MCI0645307.1 beta galactosidase jelly roll domain-containing protein [Chloroflexota bacterium]MCI0729539.1 beta galactosidase jelly roll domain-containing protein [Chloroflexota bacterium]
MFKSLASPSISLSGEWRFAVDQDGDGDSLGWARPAYNDSTWLPVTIPHTWNVLPDYREYEGLAWYRRSFTVPVEAAEAHLRLRFEAVYYLARVWLNGQYLGEHEGGYTPFEFDVSGLVETRRNAADNVVAVQVDNRRTTGRIPAVLRPGWSFDWWNYGGLVRDVSLEVTSRAYIARQQIVAVPHLAGVHEAEVATITTTLLVENHFDEPFYGRLAADVLDETTRVSALSAPAPVPISLPPGQATEVQLVVTLASPRLWHFDQPYLYRWSTCLLATDGQMIHSREDTFGVRLIELKKAQFFLNGEPMRLVGLTRHADSPEHGLAEPVTVMAADYDDLKRLNMVFSRPVHYPQHPFILDYADRHGILLIPEVPAWQLTAGQLADPKMLAVAQQQLREMIAANFNHPSVWAWSVGNEFDSNTDAGHDYVRQMIALAKSLDPARPVSFASNRLNQPPGDDAAGLADFVMMNQYFGTWAGPKEGLGQALDRIHQTWPDKPVIISEFGFEPHWNSIPGIPLESPDPRHYYLIPEDVPSESAEADEQRRQLIAEQMAVFREKPFVAGAIFWTYQDYRTRFHFVMGVVDGDRNRRESWALLRQEYTPILVESVRFADQPGGGRMATVALRTRGPVERDLPAYTLRGYRLHWTLSSPDGTIAYEQGDLPLPTLAPGAAWEGIIGWLAPKAEYVLSLSIVRPTGDGVLEARSVLGARNCSWRLDV